MKRKRYMTWPQYLIENAEYFADTNNNGSLPAEIFCIEECSELQKELTKSLRNKCNREHVVEELTDVFITLNTIRYKYGITVAEMDQVIISKLKKAGVY